MSDAHSSVIAALDRVDPELGAFISVDTDAAINAARSAPAGRLSNLTVAVKDLIEVAGMRTTYGSLRFADHWSTATAPAIVSLQAEGAIVIGKTNLNEFAFGVTGYNPHYGTILCPSEPSKTAGGSSGGSAAAAAVRACRVAVGTDTSGSVRIPAACCDVWGFKHAWGADLTGIYPLAPSFDSLGYLAAEPGDLELVLGLGELPEPGSVAVGVAEVDVELPPLPAAHWTVFREEAWAVHGAAFTRDPGSYGADLRRKLQMPRGDSAAAKRTMAEWRQEYAAAVGRYDVVVDRVFDGGPPSVVNVVRDYDENEAGESDRLLARTPAANALGWPALAFPTIDGPRQVSGPPGSEPALFAVARSWHAAGN
jgi:aspartyl-tRNA(Asn)/glutamyl-tRNA(Gln) amidotransferase subunit A